MSNQETEKKTLQESARLLERVAWALLLLCAVDLVLNVGLLGAELRVFFSALAATLLVIGIVLRKKRV